MPRPKSERPTYSLARRGASFYVQWWEGGRARRVSCRTADKGQASRFLAEFIVGRDAPDVPLSPTISAVLDGYLAEREAEVHSTTIKYDCASLKRHLGETPADLLGDVEIKRYTVARRSLGARGAAAPHRQTAKPLSNGTLIRELGTLRAALAWAVRRRWLKFAPFVDRPTAPPSRERWLTQYEAEKLLASARQLHVRVFIALALYTAARASALLQLTWGQVDLAGGRIDLGESRGRKRRARVPIADELRPFLDEAKAAATSQFVVEYGGSPVASIKTGFRAAAKRAGLSGVTPHVCRHTAASWMVQQGVKLEHVAAFLGDTQETVERVYGHHSPDWLKDATAALSVKTRPTGGPADRPRNFR